MSPQMPSINSKKRSAPGASPGQASAVPQSHTASSQLLNADFSGWSKGSEETSSEDQSAYLLNNYGTNSTSQAGYTKPSPAHMTQLARRPMNQQLVHTGQGIYDSADPWGQLGDELILDQHNGNGQIEENDNIEALEEKAAIAKRDAQAKRKQIPPFVQKLSSFLEESRNTDLIRWSERGDSFIVLDEDEFAKTLIPELFKHNNYASFVRQLNMYGFHKRVGLSDNSMKASERKNKSPSEYYNQYFKRGHPNLLWLINKPKGGNTKNKKRVKEDDGAQIDSDDEKDVEEVYGNNIQNSRVLSAVPESNSLQRQNIAILQNQLSDIQKHQGAITNALQRLRKDHNQLYQQSMAFQSLHDRHENSINAILTFLATVYNRSLDGQSPQNISQMFANGIPHDQQKQGSVVDIGDVSQKTQQNPGSMSPMRKAQLLLMAPPRDSLSKSATPAASTPKSPASCCPQDSAPQATIEELFETSPADTSGSSPSAAPPKVAPAPNMMSLINNTNAANSSAPPNSMQFPEMLLHYEHASGNSPLTAEQRSSMLSLIANNSTSGTNNALVSPTPPLPPSLEELSYTSQEIDDLMHLQAEQEAKLRDVEASLAPLVPAAITTNVIDTDFFNADPTTNNLDLDQYLNTGAFFTSNSPVAGGTGTGSTPFDYDQFGDGADPFELGIDGTADIKIETLESPSDDVELDLDGDAMAINASALTQIDEESHAGSPHDDHCRNLQANSPNNKRQRRS